MVTLFQDVPERGLEPDLLGLFEGSNHLETSSACSDHPPRIILYLQNLWDLAEGNPQIFSKEVQITYLHELGHFLGLDEDDLTLRDLG